MGLVLSEIYKKEIRRRKIGVLFLAFAALLAAIMITGLALMLPAYFNLTFSESEIERRLILEKELLSRRDLEGLEGQINLTNALIKKYIGNEARRFSFADILMDTANTIPFGITLSNFAFESADGGAFKIGLDGKAATRGDLINYVNNLRRIEKFASVESPLSNLLREQDVTFRLTINIKPEFYFYEE